MPYKRKLLIYFAVWFIAAGVTRVRWLSDSNFFIVFGVGLLMAIAMLVIGPVVVRARGIVNAIPPSVALDHHCGHRHRSQDGSIQLTWPAISPDRAHAAEVTSVLPYGSPARNTPVQAVNGRCVGCSWRGLYFLGTGSCRYASGINLRRLLDHPVCSH